MDPGLLLISVLGLDVGILLAIAFVRMVREARDADQWRMNRELTSIGPAFKAAARQLGLNVVRDRRLRGARMEGTLDGSRVVAQCAARGSDPWLTTITVWPRSGLPDEIWLRSRWRAGTSPADGTPESNATAVETGDPALDALVTVGGRPAAVHVLLSAPARHAIKTVARTGTVRLLDGAFVHETFERIWDADQLTSLVRSVLAPAQAFPQVSDGGAMLAEAAHGDPEPGVRARCLATLAAEEPDQPRTAAALEAALADPGDVVRVAAAIALGERGVPVLREIAVREDSDEQAAARAIAVLGRRLPSHEMLAILDSALSAGRREVALAAIDSLGHVGDESACRRLHGLLHGEDEALAVAAADALSFVHSVATEEELDRALLSHSQPVRRAVVRALARVGRLASIAHLRALLEEDTADHELKSLAQQAIAAIQARLTGASPGQVSLAESEAGELTLSHEPDSGHLSIAEK